MMETLIDRIKRHEGLRLTPYLDTTGNFTIGYGHKISELQAQNDYANGISQQDADDIFTNDLAAAQLSLANDLPWTSDLPTIKWGILVEMVFQMGVRGLLGFHDMLYCIRTGDDKDVVREMLDSAWHKQTPERCEELAHLWLNGNII